MNGADVELISRSSISVVPPPSSPIVPFPYPRTYDKFLLFFFVDTSEETEVESYEEFLARVAKSNKSVFDIDFADWVFQVLPLF